jgi:hypothetical protein
MTLASLPSRAALAALAFTLAAAVPALALAADPPPPSAPQDFPSVPGAAKPAPAAPAPPPSVTPGPPAPVPWAPAPGAPAAPAQYPPYGYPPYGYPPYGYGYPPQGWGPSPSEIPPGYQTRGGPTPGIYPAGPTDDSISLPPLPPRRRYSTSLFAGGVVAVAGGMALVLLGSYLVASGADRIDIYCDTPGVPCAYKNDGQRMTAGAVMMAGGALVGIAGIPMWLVGSRFVTIPRDETRRKEEALQPELRIGAGTATVSFRF